ncbi:MAG: proline--tRNA ligase [Turicibacter sp.]|nr:proline--tRNA ligase [Turicibacter sp.]
MKLDKLVGERFKERPADCVIDSHALMVRGGYIKQVGPGIYSTYTPLLRIARKIEQIIREEMDRIGAQEVLFPVIMPAALWEESGRYAGVGAELMRFEDRNGVNMVMGMTHEEAAVHLTREFGNSYQRYPFSVYQIQTKIRDEARPRAGLIRVREFIMKDAYSFHTNSEDLDACYDRFYEAYEKIFARAGIPEVVSVKSDSGMMGGSMAHEFMLLADVGEDTLVLCKECDFRANLEAAAKVSEVVISEKAGLDKVATPGCKTIEDVCKFLNLAENLSCKAIIYQKADGEQIVAFIRGDIEVNETKLRNVVGAEIYPATEVKMPLVAGYCGPVGLDGVKVFYDNSLKGIENLCCGANEEGFHYTGLNLERDCGAVEFFDFAKVVDGDICPNCGKNSLELARGIEVGNIFKLGDKYSKSMGMQYQDEAGGLHFPLMCSYGIGVERLAASICEVRRDDFGPIWPLAIAPWQVHLTCLRADEEAVRAVADGLYKDFLAAGIEIIYDDRVASTGVMFSDADLLGVPIRVIVSPRNLKQGVVEITSRDKSLKESVEIGKALEFVREKIT